MVAAWPEWLLSAAVPSSATGAPVEALGGSVALCVSAALRSRSAHLPEPPSVMAVVARAWGVRRPPQRRVDVLLVKIFWSLQVRCSSASAASVGLLEDGWSPRACLRRETARASWRLEADSRSSARCWRLRQLVYAASQQGCSSWWLWCEVSAPSSVPAACRRCWKLVFFAVVPSSACVVCVSPVFVCVCAFPR